MGDDKKKGCRTTQALKEFNVNIDAIKEVLRKKNVEGINIESINPNTFLSHEVYELLQEVLQGDKRIKNQADKVEIKNTNVARMDDTMFIDPTQHPFTNSNAIKKEKEDTSPIFIKSKFVKIEEPEIQGKIDLSKLNKPLSQANKVVVKETAKEATIDVVVLPPPPVHQDPPVVQASITTVSVDNQEDKVNTVEQKTNIEDISLVDNVDVPKITGPKIMGKIVLPIEDNNKKEDDYLQSKVKRERKKIIRHDHRPHSNSSAGGSSHTQDQPVVDNRRASNNNNNNNNTRYKNNATYPHANQPKIGIDKKEIENKIKETQAKLNLPSSKGRSLKAKYRKEKRQEQEIIDGEMLDSQKNKLQITEFVTVSELAHFMNVDFTEVISKCMNLGVMVSINQRLDAEVMELVANEFGYEIEFIEVKDIEEEEEGIDDPNDLTERVPVVTIMGHVDHGKTSLLDQIRSTNIVSGEAGGITQHIGAYAVLLPNNKRITFLDTPGHEAFTAMRARGAKVTDIAVIVIAADDAVMPQTKEAISHAQAAGVPMIFAINKIDKPGANPQKIYEQLSQMNLLVEEWGGKFQSQQIAAKSGLNINLLLEKILLEADVLQLKANPKRLASGTIVEASLDKGRGFIATLLVQNGTLRQGDMVLVGQYFGRIKAMFDEHQKRIDTAGPSTPVVILGLNGAPQAGELFRVYTSDESEVREIATKRAQIIREQGLRARKHITLDEIGRRLALGNFKELCVIIKGDVDGSVEALSDSLQKLSTPEIAIRIIHKGVGQISESDVLLANASDAIIIGFNVRPSVQANKIAQNEGVQIKMYSIIYTAIDELKSAMEGMLEPTITEIEVATVEVKNIFKFDKVTVAGCFVLEGKIKRDHKVRLFRDGILLYPRQEGAFAELGSLKRFKDDAKEVASNTECGITIKNFSDIQVGDSIVAYDEEEVKRTL